MQTGLTLYQSMLKSVTFFISETLPAFIFGIVPEEHITNNEKMTTSLQKISNPNLSDLPSYMHALYEHKEVAQRIVHSIKYKKSSKSADIVANQLCKYLENKVPCFINPLPSSVKRIRERGYDHLDIIMRALKKCAEKYQKEITFVQYLEKKHTRPQTRCENRDERIQNSKNTFEFKRGLILSELNKSSLIILFDDVITTGSTMNDAYRCLTESGCTNILCVAFSHAPLTYFMDLKPKL